MAHRLWLICVRGRHSLNNAPLWKVAAGTHLQFEHRAKMCSQMFAAACMQKRAKVEPRCQCTNSLETNLKGTKSSGSVRKGSWLLGFQRCKNRLGRTIVSTSRNTIAKHPSSTAGVGNLLLVQIVVERGRAEKQRWIIKIKKIKNSLKFTGKDVLLTHTQILLEPYLSEILGIQYCLKRLKLLSESRNILEVSQEPHLT